jgi:general stress protein 26
MIQRMPQAERGDVAKLTELIRAIRVGLLTTVNLEGQFHSRPVETLDVEAGEALWFFTDRSSPKAQELRHDARVSLGYADPSRHWYAVVRGTASLLHDPGKARQLWTLEQRAYYPDGPEDERLALLRVRIDQAEYWIAPGRVSYWWVAARAAVTGVPADIIGENRKFDTPP